jgi:uncharacterized protein
LSRLDGELGSAFQKRRAQISAPEQSKFAADQLAWIKARNTHCGLDGKGNAAIEALASAKPCMAKAIRERLAFLAQTNFDLTGLKPLDAESSAAAQPQSGSPGVSPGDWIGPDEGAREECDPDAIAATYNPFKGVTDAAQREALVDGLAAVKSGDYAKALRQFRPLADQGTAAANGQGVPQSYAEAAKWFRLAANQGDAIAEGWLGAMYYRGDIPRDYAEAAKWSCLAGKQGDAPAQSLLGAMYGQGKGVEKNDVKAVKWIRLAADQGFSEAQASLGVMYDKGEGVPRDYAEAVKWYRLAANQGDARAQLLLGGMYLEGQGVTQDYAQAYMWFNLSAAQGFEGAAKARDIVTTFMTPAQIAEAQRVAREWRPKATEALSTKSETQSPSPEKRDSEAVSGTAFFVAGEGSEVAREVREVQSRERLQQPPTDGPWTKYAQPNIYDQFDAPSVTREAPSGENPQGIALTNAHVVEACRQIEVRSGTYSGTARVVARDDQNDLALLATNLHPPITARWRFSTRQGEDIVVYGFPLAGVLATGGNVATGSVTALAGLRDDSRFLQISAPVQPGNSGGPLLDKSGNVVGIVVAKLDALKIVSATGDIPQNVNFAIKASAAAAFLDAQSIPHAEGAVGPALSTPEIAERARKLTMHVVCIR